MATNRAYSNRKIWKLVLVIILLLFIIIFIGVIGFKFLFDLSWTDAIYNATITASTLGIDVREKTTNQKLFTGVYAIMSVIFIIALISAIISYIVTIYVDGLE